MVITQGDEPRGLARTRELRLRFSSALMLSFAVLATCAAVTLASPAAGAPRRAPCEGIAWNEPFRLIRSASAYPRVASLADGSLLCGVEEARQDARAIGVVRSTDLGRTWSEMREIAVDRGNVDLANVLPLQLRSGDVVAAYRHHRPAEGSFSLRVAGSSDGGRTWSPRGTIAVGKQGLWEPFLLERPDGSLQAYYASEEGLKPFQRIEMVTSDDHGATWGTPVTVASAPGSRDGMPGVVALSNRELLAVFEAQDVAGARFAIRSVRSTDGGATWSAERALVHAPRNDADEPWAAGAPCIVRSRDGRLIVSFQTDEDVARRAGDVDLDPKARGYDYLRHCTFKVVIGDARGRSWDAPITIDGGPDRPALWNALHVLPDGTLLALSGLDGKVWSRRGEVR